MKRRSVARKEVASELLEALQDAARQGHPTGTLVTLSQLLSQSSLLGPEAFEILLWGIAQSPALRDTLRKAPPPEAADIAGFLDFVPEIAFVLGKSRKGKALLDGARLLRFAPDRAQRKPPVRRSAPAEYEVLADLLQLGNVFLGYRRRIEYLERRLISLESLQRPESSRGGKPEADPPDRTRRQR